MAARLREGEKLTVVDVRLDREWREGHIPGAVHIELGELKSRAGELPRDSTVAVTCSVGQRSSTGVSMLQALGFQQVENIAGGTTAWKRAGFPVAQ